VYKSRSFVAFGVLPCGLLAASMTLCGCERSEKITRYTVPKHESLQTAEFQADYDRRHPKPERMIGVVIPRDTVFWFFKLPANPGSMPQATPDAVAARANDVRDFLKTLRFPENQPPAWTLPPGWRQLKGSEMRFATLVLDGEPALEMSVTQLPTQPDMPIVEQIVSNINRWRNQLSLPPVEAEDLGAFSEKLPLDNATAYWIDIVGRPKPRPAGMPQTAGPAQQPEGHPPNAKPPAMKQPAKPADAVAPIFETPQGWTEGEHNGIATISLKAVDGESTVVITVTKTGGDRLANVNRWRGQLKLEPFTAEQLAANAKKVEVGNIAAEEYDMVNESKTIFGVIAKGDGQSWFIKLMGNTALAERERLHFEAFLKSLQLN
jgi:hypothetical protein